MTNGVVNIGGKEYKTVALRVNDFRHAYPLAEGWGIQTEILTVNDTVVTMQARIVNPAGQVVATGHAEELRTERGINSTSALEVCETSAIGRALAAAGFAGSEFASADEVAPAIAHQSKGTVKRGSQLPSNGNGHHAADEPDWWAKFVASVTKAERGDDVRKFCDLAHDRHPPVAYVDKIRELKEENLKRVGAGK